MVESWLHGLLAQTLALAFAAFVVRAMQWLVVRRLGAAAGYLCWLLVPVAMATVALPHPATGVLVIHVDLGAVTPTWAVARPYAGADWASMLPKLVLSVWAAGAIVLAAVLTLRQRRFAALVDSPTDGWLPAGSGPAVVGLRTRRIVLPRDFETVFDADERRLVLLHEGVHLRRGDNLWNLLAAVLLVLHWFNPIAWWAWHRLRVDQETSCDAAVLRDESPDEWPVYAGALLKVQGVALAPPLATAWQSSHPLVERVRMLQAHRISSTRHRAGLRVAALFIVVSGIGGYAVQAGAGALPATAPGNGLSVMTAIDVTQTDTRTTAPNVSSKTEITSQVQVLTRAGEEAILRIGGEGSGAAPFEIGLTVTRLDGGLLDIQTHVRGGTPLAALGSPRLVVHDGEKGSVSVNAKNGSGKLEFAISLTPKVVASPIDAAGAREPKAEGAQRAL